MLYASNMTHDVYIYFMPFQEELLLETNNALKRKVQPWLRFIYMCVANAQLIGGNT